MDISPEGWERIYREKGDLQLEVLPKIKRGSKVFKERGYKKILDLGCGTGKHSIFLAQKGFSVYATDISLTGIDIARKKARSLNLDTIQFKQHDMRSIPFTNNFFDAVICIWTIYHGTLDEIRKTVSEIWRVLKPNGMVITDFLSISDSTYGIGKEIERYTFLGAKVTEEDVPHHYTTREELLRLFSQFQQVKIRSSSNSYVNERGENYIRKYFNVQAIK
jgi:ubiquinone/menaquinone biosynthesis C-methylase UbiE